MTFGTTLVYTFMMYKGRNLTLPVSLNELLTDRRTDFLLAN